MSGAADARGPTTLSTIVGCGLISAAILALDAFTPQGISVGMLYAAVILVALRAPRTDVAMAFAVSSSVLVIVGSVLSGAVGSLVQDLSAVIANRGLSLAVIWTTALLGIARQSAERAAARTAARLEAVLDTVVDAVVTTSPAGTILSVNPAAERMFGYPAGELIGREASLVMRAHDGELHLRAARQVRARGLRRDGTELPIEVSVGELTTEPLAFVAVVRDVTERDAVEARLRGAAADLAARTTQLEATNQELEAFSYSVSHDLRAPLRAIEGFSRILFEDHATSLDDEGRRVTGVIRKNARKMALLIDDLLTFSRSTRRRVEPSHVRMSDLAQAAFDQQMAGDGEAVVELELEPLPDAYGDASLLMQVWVNLIGNAVKYSRGRAPQRIRVRGRADAGELVYEITDNGIGFDMAYADKLFGVFERLHRDDEFEGSGIGLALVRRIVSRHGGRVWAEGRVDDGATFGFALPRPAPGRPVDSAS